MTDVIERVGTSLRAIRTELASAHLEREDLADAMILAVVAAHHLFILGSPGSGKSRMIDDFFSRFLGARVFDTQMHEQQSGDEILGPFDVKEMSESGRMIRRVDGFLPTCHFGKLDEAGKASPSTYNPLLTALNERRLQEEGRAIDIPLISVFGGSNEWLGQSEFGAAADRYLLRTEVESIQSPGNFDRLLQLAVEAPAGPPAPRTTVGLEDLLEFQEAVRKVELPDGVRRAVATLKKQLSAEHQIFLSDRRWVQSMRVVQASAAINGRKKAASEDLVGLRFTLWDQPANRVTVDRIITELSVPDAGLFQSWERDMRAWVTQMDAIDGPSSSATQQQRHTLGKELDAKVSRRLSEVNAASNEASQAGRPAEAYEAFASRLAELRLRVYSVALGIDPSVIDVSALSRAGAF